MVPLSFSITDYWTLFIIFSSTGNGSSNSPSANLTESSADNLHLIYFTDQANILSQKAFWFCIRIGIRTT